MSNLKHKKMRFKISRMKIHTILPTHEQKPIITDSNRDFILFSIYERLTNLQCQPFRIEIQPDHVHIIHELNPKLSLCDVIHNIKGGSSHYVNQQKTCMTPFAWHPGLISFAFGNIEVFNQYDFSLNNQHKYHSTHSLDSEIMEIKKLFPEMLPIQITL